MFQPPILARNSQRNGMKLAQRVFSFLIQQPSYSIFDHRKFVVSAKIQHVFHLSVELVSKKAFPGVSWYIYIYKEATKRASSIERPSRIFLPRKLVHPATRNGERKKKRIYRGGIRLCILPQRRLSNVEGKGWHVSRRERRDGSARVSDFRFPMVKIKEARSGKAGSSADRKVQELVSFFAEERKGNCERIEGARGKCNWWENLYEILDRCRCLVSLK